MHLLSEVLQFCFVIKAGHCFYYKILRCYAFIQALKFLFKKSTYSNKFIYLLMLSLCKLRWPKFIKQFFKVLRIEFLRVYRKYNVYLMWFRDAL